MVEDDKNLGFIIKDFLEISQYHVIHKENGKEGLQEFVKNSFDLVLLDIMLPLTDGFTVAEEIRKRDSETPIIFITAKSMTEDRIKGFMAGADDYITKPFSTEELRLRINAVLRRTRFRIMGNGKETTFKIGKFTFDYKNHMLVSSDKEIRLTKREADVLNLLCLNVNNILRRDIALKTIWGEDDYFMGRSMDVYITKLRKYLRDDPSVAITNIHNTGFMLEVKQEINSQ
ncbi:MAG: response regulator transcription factor [Bacteroidales bacterium]|nr:response regulator transcription factor [Bacteroidales bacterium]